MQLFKRKEVDEDLQAQINALYVKLRHSEDDPEEYAKWSQQLALLVKLRAEGRPKRVSRDTIWFCAANLAGVALIVFAERTSVMISKGFNHLYQPKVQQ